MKYKKNNLIPRKSLIFVGATRTTLDDGRMGGQAFACRSLITSDLSEIYNLVPIDSSIASILDAKGLARAPSAIYRVLQLLWHLLAKRPVAAIIFTSHGLSFLEKGLMVLICRAMGVRTLLMPRSGHLTTQVERSPAFRSFVGRIIAASSLTICQSNYWEKFFNEVGNSKGHLKVVENWLPESAFVAQDAPVSSSGGQNFTIGFFNRIEESKGIFDFIDTIDLAIRKNRNLRAVIYGDGTQINLMQARIVERGLSDKISYEGWLSDTAKSQALRRLDASLFCSHAEGFPNALLEIIAMKIPVISVRVGAVPDMLIDGETGLLGEVGDVSLLADHIITLAHDHGFAARLAEGAYRRAWEHNRLETAVNAIKGALK
jgi:glycosyltransferase involved in cell wall biosynthesis